MRNHHGLRGWACFDLTSDWARRHGVIVEEHGVEYLKRRLRPSEHDCTICTTQTQKEAFSV